MTETWLSCKIYIRTRGGKPRQAYVVLHNPSGALEPHFRVTLLLRHPNGTVIGVPGRVARRRSRDAVEIYVPVDAALTLAVWMNVKVEGNAMIYGYVAKIESVQLPV
jgi:hypothetical protein